MAEILCFSCVNFAPALDPNIAKAFIGGCRRWEAPFTLILKEGVTECPLYERGARVHRPAAVTAAGPAASKAVARKRVELYYSSKHATTEAFPFNRERALELLKGLQAKGIEAEARDLAEMRDVFLRFAPHAETGQLSLWPAQMHEPEAGNEFADRVKAFIGRLAASDAALAREP